MFVRWIRILKQSGRIFRGLNSVFLNSPRLSERLLLVSCISASNITPLTKMQQQLASAAAVINNSFIRLVLKLD